MEWLHRAAQGERDHAAGGVGGAGEAEVIFAGGGVQRPEDIAHFRMRGEKRGDLRGVGVDFFEDAFRLADLRGEAGEVARVNGIDPGGGAAAELGGVGAGGIERDKAGGEVALARGVFGEAGDDRVGVAEEVEVEEAGDRWIDEEVRAVLPAERRKRGEVGRLDERVGRQLGEDPGNARAVFLEDAGDALGIQRVAHVDVVGGRGREFFQDRDGVEVEPAELEPDGATARGLQIGGSAERGVDGVHARGGEKEIAVRALRQRATEHAANLGGGVAGKGLFRVRRGEQAEAHERILGFARGEESAAVLEKRLRTRGGVGGCGVRGSVQGVVRKYFRAGLRASEVRGEFLRHPGRRRQPQRASPQRGHGGREMRHELPRERMHDEARVARGEGAHRLGPFLLVAPHIAHRGQAARDSVGARRNALAERQVSEGHGEMGEWRSPSLALRTTVEN